jgi:hypothetical protein
MTPGFRVEWSEAALEDWRRLPLASAEVVARAVAQFPADGIVLATGPTEYLLLIGELAVVLLIDGDTLHVDRIRHA